MSLILSAAGEFWSHGAMTIDVVIYSSLYALSSLVACTQNLAASSPSQEVKHLVSRKQLAQYMY